MSSLAVNVCRVCSSDRVAHLRTFSDVPLPDGSQPQLSAKLADLVIGYCLDCKMVQRLGDIDLSDYYHGFTYTVGGSPLMRRYVGALATYVVNLFRSHKRQEPLRVLDIGCNTGEQLIAFRDLGCDVIGVEPAYALAMLASERGLAVMHAAFDSKLSEALYAEHGYLDIITSTFTLDQVDNPLGFLTGIKRLMHPESGLVVLEVHDVNTTYASAEVALFDREHSIYPDDESLRGLLNLAGLEVVETNFLPTGLCRENSLLVIAKHSSLASPVSYTASPSRDLSGHLDAFTQLDSGINKLAAFVDDCIARDVRIAGYGAGYRGIMYCSLLQHAEAFTYFVDANASLHCSWMPKSNIPVYPPEYLARNPVDCIIVFSHGYLMEIQETCASLGYPKHVVVSLPRILSGDINCVDIRPATS